MHYISLQITKGGCGLGAIASKCKTSKLAEVPVMNIQL